MYMYNMVMNS